MKKSRNPMFLRKATIIVVGLASVGTAAYAAAPESVRSALADCCALIGVCCSFMSCCG